VTLLAAALALALGADPQAELAAAQARKAAEEAAAHTLAAKETSVLGVLEDAHRARAEAEHAAARAEAERRRAEAAVARARADEAAATARYEAALARLGPRLAARARMGRLGGVRLLLVSRSVSDLARRRYALERILERDAALLRQARVDREAGEAARRTGEQESVRLAPHHGEDRALRLRLLVRLGALIASLSAAPPREQGHPTAAPARGFAALRGKLPRPVDGPIVAGFGRVVDSRFNTVTSHPGVDLRAPPGAAVRAVAPGRVVHAGWFRGYGNLVIIDHGDGFHTLVARLGSMSTAVGEDVQAGTLLGTVGDGNAAGDGVYFEVRDRQRPVDPALWLAGGRGDIVAR